MKRKWLSVLLALVMVLGMMPMAVFAAEEVYLDLETTACKTIYSYSDTYDSYNVYYYKVDDGKLYTNVRFGSTFGTYEDASSMIAGIQSNFFVMGQNYAPISSDWSTDKDIINDEFDLDSEWKDYEFPDCYAYWLTDDGYNTYYVIVEMPVPESSSGFTLSTGEVIKTDAGAYTVTPWVGDPYDVDVYTVAVPFGTEAVELTFTEERIAYGYASEDPDSYLCSCGATGDGSYENNGQTGQLKAIVKMQDNYELPGYVMVQTPFDAGYNSTTLYAITFVYTYTFTVKADGTACDVVNVEPGAYGYYDWMANETEHVPIYTVSIPAGTEEVDITLSDPGLLYNYSFTRGDEGGTYLAGYYQMGYPNPDPTDEACVGLTEFTIDVDSNDDGEMDFIQVQRFFNTDNSGGDLYYVITFEKEPEPAPFTASVGTVGEKQDDAYEVKPYVGDAYKVPVYPLTIDETVDEITFTFTDEVIAYEYDADGGYIGDCSGNTNGYENGGMTGKKTGIAARTASGVMPDYVVVQTPYDADSNSTTLYAIKIEGGGTVAPPEPVTHKDDIADDVQSLLDALLAEDPDKPAADYTIDWALAMHAAGKTPTDNELKAFLQNTLVEARSDKTGVGSKAKYAIALSALGIDATQIPGENDEVIDLVADVYSSTEADITGLFGPDAYVAPFILDLYELGIYDIPDDALSEDFLLQLILDGQADDGSWYGEYGADATGMVLPGLAPFYQSNADVKVAVDKAVAYLETNEDATGYLPGYNNSPSVATNAVVSVGLHALGINDHNDDRFVNDDCVIGWLLAKAGDQQTFGNNIDNLEAAWALATLQNLDSSRNENLYLFDGNVSVYTDWPDADLLTGIAVTTQPEKTTYEIGETFDPAGLVVTATYNADADNTKVIADGYTLFEPDMTTAGNKTVTVTYQGQEATFIITVRNEDGSVQEEYAYITVKTPDDVFVAKTKEDIVVDETTAMDLLKSVLGREGISYVIKGNYVESINGLAEMDGGPNSGWMYMVNGSLPGNGTIASDEYNLKNKDDLVWFYTNDYTEEEVVKPTLPTTPEEETPAEEGETIFTDVKDSDWYDEYAYKAAEEGLFAGYAAGTDEEDNELYEFRGKDTMTRAMFVTVLRALNIRLKGETEETPDTDFTDVPDGAWFEAAVNWAYANGLTAGKGEAFGVDDPVTREQMAVLLYGYAKMIGKVSGEPDLTKLDAFNDADQVSDYAKEAIAWLVGEGLMAGRGEGMLAPGESSTRAEVAAFMVSCLDYLAK